MSDRGAHQPRCERCWRSLRRHVREKLLLILTMLGTVFGFTIGFSVRPFEPSHDALLWIGLPGEVFIRMLKMMTLPLIVCSVISGSASVEPQLNGKMTLVACLYAFITNIIACFIAVLFCIIIKPGKGLILSDSPRNTDIFQTQDIFADLIRNLLPDNIVEAAFAQAQTKYDVSTVTNLALNTTNGTMYYNSSTITKSLGKVGSSNFIGLIVVSMILGLATNSIGAKGKPFLKFFASASEIILIILRWFLWATPIGVCSLIAVSLAAILNVQSTFTQLAMLIVTVVVALLVHQFLFLPLLLLIFLRRNPLPFLLSLARAWMVAFASCSTAAALPEMIRTCEEANKIDKRVTRFVLPLCISINADGSGIYVTITAIFVAAVTGNDTSVGLMFLIGILTAIAALAIPSVPSASIVTLIMILTSLNIDVKTVGLLFAVEWLLDRLRTGCNVFTHTTGTIITYELCRERLRRSESPLTTNNHDDHQRAKFLQTEIA